MSTAAGDKHQVSMLDTMREAEDLVDSSSLGTLEEAGKNSTKKIKLKPANAPSPKRKINATDLLRASLQASQMPKQAPAPTW